MQKNNSNEVFSNQQGIHENLESIVRKHFETEYKKPIADHTQIAFENIRDTVEIELNKDTPLLFDSFCGTGMSTSVIAKKNPNSLVIGIDRSLSRLSKSYNETLPTNAILIHAECADFWLLAKQAGWELAKHTLYYPNPYPKSKHIKRRIHAHPAFPLLFALKGEIELRTNWKIYADEFEQSLSYVADYISDYAKDNKVENISAKTVCFDNTNGDKVNNTEFMTLFEKKYFLNGQKLYSCIWH